MHRTEETCGRGARNPLPRTPYLMVNEKAPTSGGIFPPLHPSASARLSSSKPLPLGIPTKRGQNRRSHHSRGYTRNQSRQTPFEYPAGADFQQAPVILQWLSGGSIGNLGKSEENPDVSLSFIYLRQYCETTGGLTRLRRSRKTRHNSKLVNLKAFDRTCVPVNVTTTCYLISTSWGTLHSMELHDISRTNTQTFQETSGISGFQNPSPFHRPRLKT